MKRWIALPDVGVIHRVQVSVRVDALRERSNLDARAAQGDVRRANVSARWHPFDDSLYVSRKDLVPDDCRIRRTKRLRDASVVSFSSRYGEDRWFARPAE
jgi:hypothetical protein